MQDYNVECRITVMLNVVLLPSKLKSLSFILKSLLYILKSLTSTLKSLSPILKSNLKPHRNHIQPHRNDFHLFKQDPRHRKKNPHYPNQLKCMHIITSIKQFATPHVTERIFQGLQIQNGFLLQWSSVQTRFLKTTDTIISSYWGFELIFFLSNNSSHMHITFIRQIHLFIQKYF